MRYDPRKDGSLLEWQRARWCERRDMVLPYLDGGLRERLAAARPWDAGADVQWLYFDDEGRMSGPSSSPGEARQLFSMGHPLFAELGELALPSEWGVTPEEWRLGRV